MTKKTLYLHVGMGKTGTTALQNFFHENSGALKSSNISYPSFGQKSNAHHLLSPHQPPFLKLNGWTFLEPELWKEKAKRINTDNILISSELMAWAERDAVLEYCRQLSTDFNLKPIFYLRRQDNIIMASYNQQVKAGSQKRHLRLVMDRQLERFDFLARIEPWAIGAGQNNIVIRAYEREQFFLGDIRKDFLKNVLGLTDLNQFNFKDSKNSNPRYSKDCIDYKLFLNNAFPETSLTNKFNSILLDFSAKQSDSSTRIFTEHDTLSPTERKKILDHFEADNQFIAKEFLENEGKPLFQNMTLPKENDEEYKIDENQMREISSFISKKSTSLHKMLLKRIENIQDDQPFLVVQARNYLRRSLSA